MTTITNDPSDFDACDATRGEQWKYGAPAVSRTQCAAIWDTPAVADGREDVTLEDIISALLEIPVEAVTAVMAELLGTAEKS